MKRRILAKALSALFCFLVYIPKSIAQTCHDFEYLNLGFEVHKNSEFETIKNRLLDKMHHTTYSDYRQGSFLPTGSGQWYNFLLLYTKNLDETVFELDTQGTAAESIEFRWYENQKKHIVYKTNCAIVGAPQKGGLFD